MKILLFISCLLSLTSCQNKSANLDNQLNKTSYALGVQIGQNLRSQNIEIDNQALLEGIEQGKKGLKNTSEKSVQEGLLIIQENVTKNRTSVNPVILENNQKALEENKKNPKITTLGSGLQYRIDKAGSGAQPASDSTVSIHYAGKLINGTEFDSTYANNQPRVIKIDQAPINGLKQVLPLLKVGTKATVWIPASLAYGSAEKAKIPPYSVLVYEIEMLGIK